MWTIIGIVGPYISHIYVMYLSAADNTHAYSYTGTVGTKLKF